MPVKLKTAAGGSVSLQGHASQSSDTTLTFPNGTGSNTQALTTDGSGNLSWAAAGGGGVMPNIAINGGMRLSQRGSSKSSSTDKTYLVDRFSLRNTSANESFTQEQSTDSPAGFINSLKVTAPSSYSSGGSLDYVAIEYRPEGYDFEYTEVGGSDAKAVTISFWVKSSETGTYTLAIRHSENGGLSYGTSYDIDDADTWTKIEKTITMATSGTWGSGSNAACLIDWTLNIDTGRTFPSNDSWQSADYVGVSGQEQWATTSGATFYLTGVKIEVGSSATDFTHSTYAEELAKCQRYFFSYTLMDGFWHIAHDIYGGYNGYMDINTPVSLRTASPTVSLTDTSTSSYSWYSTISGYASWINVAEIGGTSWGNHEKVGLYFNSYSSPDDTGGAYTDNEGIMFKYDGSGDAYLHVDAEL